MFYFMKKMKNLLSKMVILAIEFKQLSFSEHEVPEDPIEEDEEDEIVRQTRSKRTRRIDSTDCHLTAQKSAINFTKNVIFPTDIELKH